jgi:hypothetical protein
MTRSRARHLMTRPAGYVAPFGRAIPLQAAVLAFAALGSCGGDRSATGGSGANGTDAELTQASQLFADDFKGVCSGASVSAATVYDSNTKPHKALYFVPYKDDLTDQSTSLPDDWTVRYSPNADAFRAVDLVVCARRTAAPQVKICDGYKDNGRASQNKVRWHTATYELSVREARTGRTLAEKTVDATDSDCPWFVSFDNDTETVDAYASLSDSAVADFLRPHITH